MCPFPPGLRSVVYSHFGLPGPYPLNLARPVYSSYPGRSSFASQMLGTRKGKAKAGAG